MERDILKLIYDYSRNSRFVDVRFIDKLIELVVRNRSLDSYVKRVAFTNALRKDNYSIVCAAYDVYGSSVVVDTESFATILNRDDRFDCLFNDIEVFFYRNYKIAQIILHELEHASQFKKSDNENDKSVEAEIIRACLCLNTTLRSSKMQELLRSNDEFNKFFELVLKSHKATYREYYKLCPIERLAEIYSHRTLLDSIELIKDITPRLYDFYLTSLAESMLLGYEEAWKEGSCPTQVYLKAIKLEDSWNELDFSDESQTGALNKRLLLGLPVSQSEYDSVNEIVLSSDKHNV